VVGVKKAGQRLGDILARKVTRELGRKITRKLDS
jgi:hypothetical protein